MKGKFLSAISFLLLLATLLVGCGGGKEEQMPTQDQETTTAMGGELGVTTQKPQDQEILIDLADVLKLTAADVRKQETQSGKHAAVSIDIICELYTVAQTRSKIRGTMTAIKNLGVSRVYLIMCSPEYPLMSGGRIAATNVGLTASNITKSLENLGEDPNKVYIELCHELGMEAIAIVKPYEGGGGATVPEGQNVDRVTSSYGSKITVDTVGGERIWLDSFVSKHPEMRVKRKTEAAIADTKIKTVELLYYTGTTPSASELETMNSEAAHAPTLWVSRDNGSYAVYANATYRYDTVSSYKITDPNGQVVMTRNCLRLQLTVPDGFDYPYVAVTLRDDNYVRVNSYWSRPYSMSHLYNAEGTKIPSTLGYYVRTPYNAKETERVWGMEGSPAAPTNLSGIRVNADGTTQGIYGADKAANGAENFYKYGFEYEFVYTSAVQNGFSSPVIALAVGKNEYVQGLLCEGYEEVRAYWLSQVKSALDYGADGIDIRYDGHSAMVSDYYYYGYNEPILQAYQKKYGTSLANEEVNSTTARRVMELRGEFFMMFLEEAAKLTHQYGGIFVNHIFATGYDAYKGEGYIPSAASNCFAQWKMPKIILADYQHLIDISDEITYKDYFSQYFPEGDQEYGKKLTEYAHAKGKKIWIHCYVQQASQLNDHFMRNFVASYADGVTLYEIVPSFNYGNAYTFLEKYVLGAVPYSISIMGRISGIAKGSTARQLIETMHFLGENVVVDADGKSVSLDTVLTDDMRLCLNGSVFYTLQLR